MYIDTHAHINHKRLFCELDEVIHRAKDAGLEKILIPNIDVSTIEPIVEIETNHKNFCHSMVGIHPTDINAEFEPMLQAVENWADKHNFCAIGEIGIDLYWDKTFIKEQIIAFERQLDLAQRQQKPVAIHVRESFDETFAVLDAFGKLEFGGVLHCFTGNAAQGKHAIDLGLKLGIGGVVTYPKSGLAETLAELPLSELMLETDAPFLPPVPYRGKRNEPAYLPFVAEKLAEVHKCSVDEIARITTVNAKKVFNLE